MRTSVAALADCDEGALAATLGEIDVDGAPLPVLQAAKAAPPAVAATAPRNALRVMVAEDVGLSIVGGVTSDGVMANLVVGQRPRRSVRQAMNVSTKSVPIHARRNCTHHLFGVGIGVAMVTTRSRHICTSPRTSGRTEV